jgi:hypothetical protein
MPIATAALTVDAATTNPCEAMPFLEHQEV